MHCFRLRGHCQIENNLQLAIRGCAACKHWQRPSCIYRSTIYAHNWIWAGSTESAGEVVYVCLVCVCTQAMGICWH